MDDKLQEAIQTVRQGNKKEAQRQLTALLEENPEQVQGWYLLSLLVESPQKQAAYLSKTLALNPQHEKAKEHLTALQQDGSLAATATISAEAIPPKNVIDQSETDDLPEWLIEEGGSQPVQSDESEQSGETAVANETLPDWLKEPSALETETVTEENPTVVGQTVKPAEANKSGQTAGQTLSKPAAKPAKAKRAAPQSSRSLNIILGILIVLAVIVMILLAYLLLS